MFFKVGMKIEIASILMQFTFLWVSYLTKCKEIHEIITSYAMFHEGNKLVNKK